MDRRGRGRPFHPLLLLLVLLGAAAVVVSWPGEAPPLDESHGVHVAGPAALRVQLEPESAVPDAGASELAAQIEAMRGEAPDEPTLRFHADGSVSTDLGRRFMKMSVATVDADGRVHTTCVDASHGTSPDHAVCAGRER